MELDERKLKILSAIVTQYIRSGEPVGSKTVCTMNGISVSSATVRNEMSTLFDMGLLEQPHTSAGRVPSHLGYRVYIDKLMVCDPLTFEEQDELDALFNVGDPDPDQLIEDATNRLADYTECAAVSTTTTSASVFVKRVELIPADVKTVVILILASNGVIRSKICRVGFVVNRDICEFFTKFANSRLCGQSLYEITQDYLNSVAVTLGEYSRLFTPLFTAIYELCREIYEGQYFVSGERYLLSYRELQNSAPDLFRLFSSRERMTRILCSGDRDIQITIGKENRSEELAEASMIIARFPVARDCRGAIGVIGPVRLPYSRLIPHLEYFAVTLGKLLTNIYTGSSGGPEQDHPGQGGTPGQPASFRWPPF